MDFFDKCRVGLIILVILTIIGSICVSCSGNFNDTTVTATVTDKQRITSGNSGYYLIYCEDNNGNYYEFADKDAWFRGKFDASHSYNQIKIGKTYEFTVVGYRIPLFSWYQNIINFKEIV